VSNEQVKPSSGSRVIPGVEEHDLWARHVMVCFLQGLCNKLPLDHAWHWEPDLNTSGIWISGGTPLDYGRVSPRPAIAVDVGQYQAANIAMDQLRAEDQLTGERLHVDLVPGTLTVYALGGVETEARRLGGWISRQIRYHRRLLQTEGSFHQIGQQLAVAPPTPPGQIFQGASDERARMVAVNIPWYMQWGWYTRPIAPPTQTSLDYIQADRARDYERPHLVRLNDLRTGFVTPSGDLQVAGMRKGPEPTNDE